MRQLVDILQRLSAHEVDFVVVGGYAVAAHGGTLVTQDVDICCRFDPENLLRIQSALSDLHPVHRMTLGRRPLDLTPETCRGLKNLYMDTDWGPVDCLGQVLGVGGFEAVKRRSLCVDVNGHAVRVLELDALIESKRAMNRLRDREAVRQLNALRERGGTEQQEDG